MKYVADWGHDRVICHPNYFDGWSEALAIAAERDRQAAKAKSFASLYGYLLFGVDFARVPDKTVIALRGRQHSGEIIGYTPEFFIYDEYTDLSEKESDDMTIRRVHDGEIIYQINPRNLTPGEKVYATGYGVSALANGGKLIAVTSVGRRDLNLIGTELGTLSTTERKFYQPVSFDLVAKIATEVTTLGDLRKEDQFFMVFGEGKIAGPQTFIGVDLGILKTRDEEGYTDYYSGGCRYFRLNSPLTNEAPTNEAPTKVVLPIGGLGIASRGLSDDYEKLNNFKKERQKSQNTRDYYHADVAAWDRQIKTLEAKILKDEQEKAAKENAARHKEIWGLRNKLISVGAEYDRIERRLKALGGDA